jgi:predicted RNase H-like nuclease
MMLAAGDSGKDASRKALASAVRETHRAHPLAGFEDKYRVVEYLLAQNLDLSEVADILGRWVEQLIVSLDSPRPVPNDKKERQFRLRTAKRNFEEAFRRSRGVSF